MTGGDVRDRATDWDGIGELVAPMYARADEAYRNFQPRPSDVIISPYAKCGTTWLQQIVHALRTCGDMDFDDVYEVIPFIDVAPVLGIDLDTEQPALPRAFKSHHAWDEIPKGCRYIVSFRAPEDAALSFVRFMEGWFLEPGAVRPDDAVLEDLVELDPDHQYSYWHHLTTWLTRRDDPQVLLLTFEDMKEDLPGAVRLIAQFLALDEPARIDAAIHNASHEFMAEHAAPFSEPMLRCWVAEHVGIPADSDASKVRAGRAGDGRRQLADATVERVAQRWTEVVTARHGFATYDDLVTSMREDRFAATA